jgi:hypothetical protein
VRLRREEGSVLLADVIIASAIVLVVAASTAAVGIIADATSASREAAFAAAVGAARTGDHEEARSTATRLAPAGSSIIVAAADGSIHSIVSAWVELPHPVVRRVRVSVVESVRVPIAPYRSNRG